MSREDSRVASLAEKVDEDLVVVETSSVGGEWRYLLGTVYFINFT